MAQPPSAIPTKLGQPSTSSPRTLETKRRQLGSLFSSLSLGTTVSSSATDNTVNTSTPARPTRSQATRPTQDTASSSGTFGDWISWLTPTKLISRHDTQRGLAESATRDERSFIDRVRDPKASEEENVAPNSKGRAKGYLENLPDEILLAIFTNLPPSAAQICSLSLVSRRFHYLAQSPVVWSQLFDSIPGFNVVPQYRNRITASECAPPGSWRGHEWNPDVNTPSSLKIPSTPIKSSIPSAYTPGKRIPKDAIQVHYPTLFRSRLVLDRLIRKSNSTPPGKLALREDQHPVYCLHVSTPWLITGSRGRAIRIWKLPNLPIDPSDKSETEVLCVKTLEEAHGGSVLAVDFELNIDGSGGTLVTGSSDMTVGVWKVTLGETIDIEMTGNLTGHQAGVLDVALGKTRIATCSKDATIRIYDRKTLDHLFTLDSHHAPVNCLALNPTSSELREEVVSASGDAKWIIWDMISGEEVRRSGGDSRGLACVTWEGDYLVTGDNDRQIKLYSAATGELLRTFEGHQDLVRTVSLDLSTRTIVSGSYDRNIRMWDLDTGDLIRETTDAHDSLVFGVAMERGRVFSVGHDTKVHIMTFGPNLPYRGLFA